MAVVAGTKWWPSTAVGPAPAGAPNGAVAALVTPTGVVVPVLGGSPGPWRVVTPCGDTATIAGGTPVKTATVVLDPGHGGQESGAVGSNGLSEADLNLAVARAAKRALGAQGITVLLTRTADYRATVQTRAAIATAVKPTAVVSVHHNGGPASPSEAPGTQTVYQSQSAESRRLAGLLYEEVSKSFAALPGVVWHGGNAAGATSVLDNSGTDYYGILRQSGVTTVISEGAFLSSSQAEAALLARPAVQQAEGEAIARAVRRFLTTQASGSGFVASPSTSPADDSGGGGGGGGGGGRNPALQ